MFLARGARTLASFITAYLLCTSLHSSVESAQETAIVYNSTSLWCANVAAEALLLSCDAEDRADVFARAVGRVYTACMEKNATQQATPVVQVMVPTALYAPLKAAAEEFLSSRAGAGGGSGEALAVVPVDVDQLQAEALFECSNNVSSAHHAWILYLDAYYPLEQLSALLDLTNLSAASTAAAALAADTPPGFARLSMSYAGGGGGGSVRQVRLLSLPLDASVPLMYYLPDVLAAHHLGVPRTWSEVLYAAQRINGTDLDGDGVPDFALCFRPDPDCTYASALGMVLAPHLQYRGTQQGAFLNPDPLGGLLSNGGAAEALRLFAGLMAHHTGLVLQGEDCLASAAARAFVEGDCAMAFGWGDLWKMSEMPSAVGNDVKGRYAIAQLPGSEVVYDRDAMVLKTCTAELCKYGINNATEQIVHQQTNATVYVNRATYVPYTGLVGAVSAGVSEQRHQQMAFDFLVYLGGRNKQLALSNDSLVVPFRSSLLNASDAALLAEFAAAGFDPNATAAYMEATTAALAHGNLVPGPIIPRVEALRALLAYAAANLSAGVSAAEVVEGALQNGVTEQVVNYGESSGWVPQLTLSYWWFIGYNPDSPSGGPDGGPNLDMPAVSLAVPVASALVVLVAATLYEFKKHRQHRSLFGKVVAPGPFEDTTLLVTDIQDSTALWETLPSSVMDRAIKEHHTCLRKLLLKHSGYESATEGDSFLLAFHCPEDALLFAMESQVALLECAWPMELLDCDVCRPYYVVHNDTDKRASLIADGVDAAGSLMALPRTNSNLSNKSTSEDTSSPQASNALGGPGSEVNTFITACQASWKEASPATPNNILIFRGLRVRMGMHTGISNEADVAYNKAAARMQYSGEILQYGKSVSDAAAGGMILLSEATYRRLPMERLWDKAMVMHVGEYKLKDDLPVLPLYQVTGRRLMGRLGYLSGMRFKEQLSKGVFTAPLGAVAMAYLGIVGVQTLLAWDEAVTREGLALLHGCVAELAHKWGGYLVEATDAQAHVVFAGAAEALLWALSAHQSLMELAWPDPLMEHELCEELIVGDVVVFRGLRVRSGVDVGHAVGEVNALTGRICYRGKVVSRAARVMQNASSNQVLASGEAWTSALAASAGLLQLRGIVGDRLGPFKLRGVADRVEMVQVRLQRADVAGADGWAQDLQEGVGGGGGGEGGETAADAADAEGGAGAAAPPPPPPRPAAGEERPLSAARVFGAFLSRNSRGATATATAPPPAAVPAAARNRTLSGAPNHSGGAGGSGSPRRFGSLRLFSGGPSRAQSFTAGLLHRMAANHRGASGRSVGAGGAGGGGGRMSGMVDASAASVSAAVGGGGAAAAGTGTGICTVMPTISVARDSGADTVSGSGAATPLPIAAVGLAATAPMAVPSAPGSGGGGVAAGMASSLPTATVTASSLTASLNILRGFRGGGGGAAASGGGSMRGGASPAGSQPFPFPSARRLLPSSWTLGGGGAAAAASGGGSPAGGLLSAGASPAVVSVAGVHGLSSSTARGSGDLSGLASMVATSLPASRTHGHVGSGGGGVAAAAAAAVGLTAASPLDVQPDVSIAMAGVDGGGGGGAPAAAAAAAAGAGGGWFPGEMLADVLHGVQEEDERLSGRGSVAASRSAGVSSVVA